VTLGKYAYFIVLTDREKQLHS